MRFSLRTALLILGTAEASPIIMAAQDVLNQPAAAVGGVIVRRYVFESGFPIHATRQVAVPLAIVIPIGRRFTFDLGSYYVSTAVYDGSGGHESFQGLTDSQIRGSYVFGRDAVVTTLLINLPTGKQQTQQEFAVTSAASSNFLQYPVNSYHNGFSVTGGVAAVLQAGGWNFGAAGSIRGSTEYTPFKDVPATKYTPGIEGRIRVGVDRLVGSSRLAAGFTFSTFSNDDIHAGTTPGTYTPGNRYIGELNLTAPVSAGSLSFYVWNYYRSASVNAAIAGPTNQENVFTGGVSGAFRLSKGVSLQPLLEARFWSPDDGSGQLYGGGAVLRFDMASRLAFSPGGRYDAGTLKSSTIGSKTVNGWEASGTLRYTF
jgi:hypothetical protein